MRRPAGPWQGRGFTLIELSVVLVVATMLLGALLVPLATQVELRGVRETQETLATIREALTGFAVARGRLPCPAIPQDPPSGEESRAFDGTPPEPVGCTLEHGFVPVTTLGLAGSRNVDGLLVDAWGNPIRYSVTRSDRNGDGRWDFVVEGQMRLVGMAQLFPDLNICTTGGNGSGTGRDTVCASAATTVVGSYSGATDRVGVPAVVFSLGPDGEEFLLTTPVTADEIADFAASLENAGERLTSPQLSVGGGPSGLFYLMNGNEVGVTPSDRVFVSRTRSGGFDDLVDWMPTNLLYLRLLEAGHLP